MTGISEILVLIFLILAVLILPRMFKPAPRREAAKPVKGPSAKMRAGIVISVLLPLLSAMILKPWHQDLILFIAIGILPVALAWALFWILSARKN